MRHRELRKAALKAADESWGSAESGKGMMQDAVEAASLVYEAALTDAWEQEEEQSAIAGRWSERAQTAEAALEAKDREIKRLKGFEAAGHLIGRQLKESEQTSEVERLASQNQGLYEAVLLGSAMQQGLEQREAEARRLLEAVNTKLMDSLRCCNYEGQWRRLKGQFSDVSVKEFHHDDDCPGIAAKNFLESKP